MSIELDVVHCCDCLEFMRGLPDKCFDAVVTSPPYNQLHHNSSGSGMHKDNRWVIKSANGYKNYNDSIDEDTYKEWLVSIVGETIRICHGPVFVNHKVRYRNGYGIHPLSILAFPFWCEIIWDRGVSMALNCNKFAPSHEVIYGFGNYGLWNQKSSSLMSVWRIAPRVDADHPCPFPEIIPNRLISATCKNPSTIFDPFCGSGTTLVAAKKLGMHYIGCDICPEYCAIAERRLAQIDGVIFNAEGKEIGKQKKLFA